MLRKIYLFLIITLIIPLFLFTSADATCANWFDDFTSQNQRWDWAYQQHTGYHLLTNIDNLSAVELGITQAATNQQYSDSSLHEKTRNYTSGSLEMRLKLSDDNGLTGVGQGTRGWGFWDADTNPLTSNVAWFWSASPESIDLASGFKMQVIENGTIHLNQDLTNVDMRSWHTYRVDITSSGTRFWVDGEEKAFTPNTPDTSAGSLRTEIWLDNYQIILNNGIPTPRYLDVLQDEKMYLDWVRYYNTVPSPTPSLIPSPFFTINDLKSLLGNYLSVNDQNYFSKDGKINALDAGFIMSFL